ncbi:MAG: hypothetical protein LBK53_08935 [Heliobacteriaceae bacterium]|nr:hypothetical protein [Heliobacteriaceae bacterium]
MNQIAIRQAKNPIKYEFPKATAEDLRRLTSESIENSYKRVAWTNPKDGKVYHLLEQARTDDGKVLVRILDHEGAFVKEAALTPKKVVIIDDYSAKLNGVLIANKEFSHGELVETYFTRNNPFAQLETISVDLFYNPKFDPLKHNLRKLSRRLNNGETFDYLSISIGNKQKVNDLQLTKQTLSNMKIYNRISGKGVRILKSGGNNEKDSCDAIFAAAKQIEGVGSLSFKGKVSNFSSSRKFSQHFEKGEYGVVCTSGGINITGLPGTDIRSTFSSNNRFLGKTKLEVENHAKELDEQIENLQKSSTKIFRQARQETGETRKLLEEKAFALQDKEKILSTQRIKIDKDFNEYINLGGYNIDGTSFSTPTRTAKLALNDMMEGVV